MALNECRGFGTAQCVDVLPRTAPRAGGCCPQEDIGILSHRSHGDCSAPIGAGVLLHRKPDHLGVGEPNARSSDPTIFSNTILDNGALRGLLGGTSSGGDVADGVAPGGFVLTHRGIFTYRTNEDGLLTNLRGFWHMGVMSFDQP